MENLWQELWDMLQYSLIKGMNKVEEMILKVLVMFLFIFYKVNCLGKDKKQKQKKKNMIKLWKKKYQLVLKIYALVYLKNLKRLLNIQEI